jgi:hypothetical protein
MVGGMAVNKAGGWEGCMAAIDNAIDQVLA